MSFLSKGLMKNAMVYKITKAFSERVKGDVITKFNKKSVHLMGSLVLELIERLNYLDINAKFTNQNQLLDDKEKNLWPIQVYIQNCAKMHSIPLPVFQKIYDQKLMIKDYFLNFEQCQAVSKGFGYHPKLLNQIYINNCGLTE